MGDLILSQSALEVPFEGTSDWVTLKEFEILVQGHPKVSRVYAFDRKTEGLSGWIRLNLALIREGYDEVLDLHSSLRTKIAHAFFFFVCLYRGVQHPRWRSLRKRRWRRTGYMGFKALWPTRLRPVALREASARLAGGDGSEKPNLRHLISEAPPEFRDALGNAAFFVAMPASAWPGKEWPVEYYAEFAAQQPSLKVVVAGTPKDEASLRLVEILKNKKVPHLDAIGKLDLKQTAWLLSRAKFLIANDTGLSHLAEAVGTPVITLYGPTRRDFGFGISGEKSRSLETSLWCSPCSKDGTLCFRMTNRYACLKEIRPADAARVAHEVLS